MSDLYVARRSMIYGRPGAESQVDRGQLVELVGCVNDEKLVRLGYVSSASKGIAIVACKVCGGKFTTDEALSSHGRERHPSRPRVLSPEDEDKHIDKMQKIEDEISPLDLTRSAASRGVRTHTGR